MTIGIPQALGYYRYGTLWKTFLEELDIPYVVSGTSNQALLADGIKHTVDESCLPLKLYMGHVASLLRRCDKVLVPRLEQLGRKDEFCVRFWGLYDTVRATFEGIEPLTYTQDSPGSQWRAFLKMGRVLGKGALASARAYRIAENRRREEDFLRFSKNRTYLRARKPKILVATNPYIAHDPFLGGAIAKQICDLGGVPVLTDGWDKTACQAAASEHAPGLYWATSRERLGAVYLARDQVDGIILLTAFPCGADCLVNELILRSVKDCPIIQIILDEHQSKEGLATRLESFLDIIVESTI